MKSRLFLLMLGVSAVCAGCFLAEPVKSTELSGAGNDKADATKSEPVVLDNRIGNIDNNAVEQQAVTGGYRPVNNDKRTVTGSTISNLDNLSKGDRISIGRNGKPVVSYDFVYIGRSDEIRNRQLAEVVGWSSVCGGLGIVIGMLIYRNNKKKLEKIIMQAISSGKQADQIVSELIERIKK